MVTVERIPIINLVIYFVLYIGVHIGLGIYSKKLEKDLENEPANEELAKQSRIIKFAFRWWPFAYVIILLIALGATSF